MEVCCFFTLSSCDFLCSRASSFQQQSCAPALLHHWGGSVPCSLENRAKLGPSRPAPAPLLCAHPTYGPGLSHTSLCWSFHPFTWHTWHLKLEFIASSWWGLTWGMGLLFPLFLFETVFRRTGFIFPFLQLFKCWGLSIELLMFCPVGFEKWDILAPGKISPSEGLLWCVMWNTLISFLADHIMGHIALHCSHSHLLSWAHFLTLGKYLGKSWLRK